VWGGTLHLRGEGSPLGRSRQSILVLLVTRCRSRVLKGGGQLVAEWILLSSCVLATEALRSLPRGWCERFGREAKTKIEEPSARADPRLSKPTTCTR